MRFVWNLILSAVIVGMILFAAYSSTVIDETWVWVSLLVSTTLLIAIRNENAYRDGQKSVREDGK